MEQRRKETANEAAMVYHQVTIGMYPHHRTVLCFPMPVSMKFSNGLRSIWMPISLLSDVIIEPRNEPGYFLSFLGCVQQQNSFEKQAAMMNDTNEELLDKSKLFIRGHDLATEGLKEFCSSYPMSAKAEIIPQEQMLLTRFHQEVKQTKIFVQAGSLLTMPKNLLL
jgi:hypothetical protein